MASNAFQPAVGGGNRGETNLSGMSKQYSARDMPANKTLKYREKGQSTQEELKMKDREGMRRELEERERSNRDKQPSQRSSSDLKRITSSSSSTSATSRSKPTETNIDADDPLDESSDEEETTTTKRSQPKSRFEEVEEEEDDDDNDDDDDDEDDTAELMAELARIKRERAAEAARLEQQKRQEEERIRMENILKGNPLLNNNTSKNTQSNDFRVKRRWDDDVVFKNCAKADGPSGEKRVARFVNDSLRSEFHRRFMDKYIK